MSNIISVTLHGVTYERDVTKLPPASVAYLLQNGFSQRLRDSFASVTEKAEPDAAKRAEARKAKLEAALAQIDSGEVPGTRVPADPAVKMAREMVVTNKVTPDELARALAFINKQRARAGQSAHA